MHPFLPGHLVRFDKKQLAYSSQMWCCLQGTEILALFQWNPESNRQFVLQIDASKCGVGAILSQIDEHGEEQH